MENHDLVEDTVTTTLSVTEETTSTGNGPCILISKRWTFTYGFFFAMLIMYAHRVNMSLAVVCMVDFSHHTTTSITTDVTTVHLNASTNTTRLRDVTNWITDVNDVHMYTNNISDVSGTNLTRSQGSCEKEFGSPIHDLKLPPELKWSRTEVSVLLSSYFYGYIFTQIPGGILTEKFGGWPVITISMAFTLIASFLMPVLATTSLYLAVALRVIMGLAGGAMIPCLISMMSHFAPAQERSKMTAFGMSGATVGIILTYVTSGYLCAYGFDRGWSSIFYIQGIATIVFLVYWCLEVHSKPDSHPRISESEKAYIFSTNKHMSKMVLTTPWKDILTSLPVFACIVGHFCYNWSFFTLLINLPLFMKEVLLFDVTQNGLFSSLPYLCMGISMQMCGHLSDLIITKKVLSRLVTRRLFTAISLIGTAVCTIAAGYISCDNRMAAVALLCIGAFFNGPAFGGIFVNHIEFAGVYSGSVYGLTNAIAAIPAMLAPLIVGALTKHGLQEEWRNVFFIAAAVNTVGAIVYAYFSKVTLEPWAQLGARDITITLETKDEETTEFRPDSMHKDEEST